MRTHILLAVAAALSIATGVANAQPYPTRPITMIVPFPPGGGVDVIARIMAPHMAQALGQPVIVENASGADGSIGVAKVVRANPDGYTLSIGITSTHVFNGAMYHLSYDLLNDLAPIGLIATTPEIIVARKAVPADDLKGLIGWLHANPGKALQATAGAGSAGHIAGVLFQQQTGTSFQFVPYRGLAPAMQGLLGDQVDMMIDIPAVSVPQLQAGRIKAKGTPKDVIAKLNAAVTATLADADVQARFSELGYELFPRDQETPEALHVYQVAEIQKWWPIIKAANIAQKD